MIFRQEFVESMTLLALTAVLTGLLIPYILKRIDERKLKEQKEFDDRKLKEQKRYEAELARQSKIIESQVQLLENLAQLLWEYQLSAILVSYYHPVVQGDLYTSAVQEYQEKSAGLFSRIRAEISKALRLTTTETYQDLKVLYYKQLIPLDMKLNGLIERQKVEKERMTEWIEFNQFAVYKLSEMVDDALDNLARELRLKGNDTKRTLNPEI